jgi:thioredoxin:protein disulfide reductase
MGESFTSFGIFIQYGFALGAGFLSILTPCVYPLIPVTLAICGASGAKSRSAAFFHSLSYVLGICVSFTVLALVFAQVFTVLGGALGDLRVVIPLSAILIALTLMTLDIIPAHFLCSLQSRAGKVGGKGLWGAFVMGTLCGIVAAPCMGPVVAAILTLALETGDTLRGGSLLFTYALGFGIPFLVLGTFASLIDRLPRSGHWFIGVKFIIALGLLLVTWHHLLPLLSAIPFGSPIVWMVLLSVGALLGITGLRTHMRWQLFFAALFISFPLHEWILRSPPPATINTWISGYEATLARARELRAPVVLDLYAEWCLSCKELEARTFPDPMVQKLLTKFVAGRVDFTEGSAESDALSQRYSVVGLPTILFLLPNGEEIPHSRITGFVPPSEFAAHLSQALTHPLE